MASVCNPTPYELVAFLHSCPRCPQDPTAEMVQFKRLFYPKFWLEAIGYFHALQVSRMPTVTHRLHVCWCHNITLVRLLTYRSCHLLSHYALDFLRLNGRTVTVVGMAKVTAGHWLSASFFVLCCSFVHLICFCPVGRLKEQRQHTSCISSDTAGQTL